MMRKIVLAVLVLLSIASLCHAKVETPNNPRWLLWDGDMKTFDAWIDKDTLVYGNCKYLGAEHSHHKGVLYWVKVIEYDKNQEHLMRSEMDFECSIERLIEGISFDGDRNTINEATKPSPEINRIYPDTRSEIAKNQLYKIGPYNKDKKAAKKTLEYWLEDTEKFKAEKNKK